MASKQKKEEKKKALEAAAKVRSDTGGQSGEGSNVPAAVGEGDPEKKTVTAEELAESTHPKAPTHPLEVPAEKEAEPEEEVEDDNEQE